MRDTDRSVIHHPKSDDMKIITILKRVFTEQARNPVRHRTNKHEDYIFGQLHTLPVECQLSPRIPNSISDILCEEKLTYRNAENVSEQLQYIIVTHYIAIDE